MLRLGDTESVMKPALLRATRSKAESALSGSPRNNARRPVKNSLCDSKVAHAAMNKNAPAKLRGFITRFT
jgi:hypothetical protein